MIYGILEFNEKILYDFMEGMAIRLGPEKLRGYLNAKAPDGNPWVHTIMDLANAKVVDTDNKHLAALEQLHTFEEETVSTTGVPHYESPVPLGRFGTDNDSVPLGTATDTALRPKSKSPRTTRSKTKPQ